MTWEHETTYTKRTRKLIPGVVAWTACNYGVIDYHLTQFFTGGGASNIYLQYIDKNSGNEETLEHAVFRCPRWNNNNLNGDKHEYYIDSQQFGDKHAGR